MNTDRLERILKLIERLSAASHSSKELLSFQGYASDNGAARRALERDLLDLKRCGVNIQSPRRGVHHIPEPSKRELSPLEVLSLYAVTRLFYHHAPTGIPEYRKVLERLTQQLPPNIRPIALRGLQEIKVANSSDRPLEWAMRAWMTGHPLRFKYLKSNKAGAGIWETYTLNIYFIELSRTNLSPYLIGHVAERNQLRTFKLSLERIKDPELLEDQHYTIPDSFDPLQFLSSAWGVLGRDVNGPPPILVQLWFHPDVAYLIKEGRFPGLQYTPLEGGALLAEVTIAVDNTGFPLEIFPWVLSFGSKVRVLEPEILRQRVLKEAKEVVSNLLETRGKVQ